MKNVAAGALLAVSVLALPAAAGRDAMAQSIRPLSVNDQAPPFALVGSDGRTYRSSDYLGKQVVVLAWFARAFSGG